MSKSADNSDAWRIALRIWSFIGAIIIAAVVFNVLDVLSPVVEFLVVGALVAFTETPIVNFLEHKGVPRGIGALIGLVVVVAVVVGFVVAISPMLFNQMTEILAKLPYQMRLLGDALSDLLQRFKSVKSTPLGVNIDSTLDSLTRTATSYVGKAATELGRGMFPFISAFASQMFVIFLGLVFAYWLACDYPRMHREVATILGEDKEEDYRFMVAVVSRSVGGYMRGMIITSIIGGILSFLGFLVTGHPYAGLMGLLTGIFHLIPVVGPWISAAFATVLALIYDPVLGLATLIVTVIAQNVTDNVISPKVMQSSVQVHPAMSLTALVIGSTLMGPIGMVVAIPLSAALKGLFIFYFENETQRQLVSYEGAIFKGTPFHDASGLPVAAYDALGDDKFVSESEIIADDAAPEAEAAPRPDLENPWPKLPMIQGPDINGWKIPFVFDHDETPAPSRGSSNSEAEEAEVGAREGATRDLPKDARRKK